MATLQSLVLSKVLSEGMANKYQSSGLKFEHLSLAYAKNETEELRNMLSKKFWSDKTKKIINALREHIRKSNLFVLQSFELSFMCSYRGRFLLSWT